MRQAEYTLINRADVSAQIEQIAGQSCRELSKIVTEPFTLFVDKYAHCDLVLKDGHLIYSGALHEFRGMILALKKLM